VIGLERALVALLGTVVEYEVLNAFFRNAQNTAVLVGALIAVAGAMLGTFLLLRGLALTSDAISHTVLLGIVVAFMIMIAAGGEPRLSSPWLLLGAAAAGVGTVLLTELIHRSGVVKEDAALGLAFPLLFAVAVILVSRYVDDVHLDEHSVMVGEIGVAWANTNSHCFGDCESVTITADDPRAEFARQCLNCRDEGLSPRDPDARFRELCTNCGDYSPAEAYRAGFTDTEPTLAFWPQAVTTTASMLVLSLVFVFLFFKELKLATFDPGLARALGFRPNLLLYALMTLVSLVAVGAFDAVGSILVIAFFIIPPATAYLLTERLGVMLGLSAVLGSVSAYAGYELASALDTSISASMVVVMLVLFVIALVFAPRNGLVSASVRRSRQRRGFEEQVLLGHVYHHAGTARAEEELALEGLETHIQWEAARVQKVTARLRSRELVRVDASGILHLTERGYRFVGEFWHRELSRTPRRRL
jgi:manganese/zinc/iron transport system permease protein